MITEFQNKAKKFGLTLTNVLVLCKVVEAYGYDFSVSYKQIGKYIGVSYECVRLHFVKLEKVGLISIEHSSTRKLVCHINEDKVNELL